MSLLRRKGKQGKDRREADIAEVAKINSELFTCDILTLLQVFRKEAMHIDSRDHSVDSPNRQDK